MMKPDAAKEPGIAENESLTRLLQNEMIVLFRTESRGLRPQLSRHAEMNPDPVSAREFKQHSLPASVRAQETASG